MKEQFEELWLKVGAKSDSSVFYDALFKVHSDKNRHYHDLTHILNSLVEFESCKKFSENPLALEFAIWYHEFVYELPNPIDFSNEEKSAMSAHAVATTTGLNKSFIDKVVDLILVTNHKTQPKNIDEKLIVDIDLSVFGYSEEEFAAYHEGIRKEYFFVEHDIYCEKRVEVLKGFLNRENIYQTPFFRRKYQKQAKKNLSRAIASLEAGFDF
ncbi:MAG: N-methyl-D-aspartate receptor NMDAR2C subunit [Nanoarchaeota archaeon]|nr:N-methyl-D-aspartate receptor NMDAR2C subunit [Nanoarchaeota archaeon]MBU1030900.1 N-methyl-D-aspartate receptor NMDAR2C subunit [Nanoarchaeota archaeon]